MELKEGDKVRLTKISKASFFIYKDYKNSSPQITCPCELKKVVLTVVQQFKNKAVLLRFNDLITIAYSTDLKIID